MLNNSRCAGLDANHCIQIAQHCGERDLLAFYTNTRSVTCDCVYVCVYDRQTVGHLLSADK